MEAAQVASRDGDAPLTDAELVAKVIGRISSTKINMARRCPEQFRRVYVLGEREPPPVSLIWGDADHKGIELDWRERIQTGKGLTTDVVLDAASDAWANRIEEEGGVEVVDLGKDGAQVTSIGDRKLVLTRLRERMLALCGMYHQQVCPTFQPIETEERFEFEVLPGLNLSGYIDVRQEGGGIRDRKTTARVKNALDGAWRLQGMIYQLAHPEPVVWDLSVKTESPRVYREHLSIPGPDQKSEELTMRVISQTVSLLAHYIRSYGIESPWPDAMNHDWACRYCGFRQSCYYWR